MSADYYVGRGRLSEPHHAVKLMVNWFPRSHVVVEYLGTPEALIAAGCATQAMLTGLGHGRRPRVDNKAFWFARRARTKAEPDRRSVTYRFADDNETEGRLALDLPGVRELLPEGLPERPPEPEEFAAWLATDTIGPATLH